MFKFLSKSGHKNSEISRSKEYKKLTKLIGKAYCAVKFNSEIIEKRQKAEDCLFL